MASAATLDKLALHGVLPIRREEALPSIDIALSEDSVNMTFADMDWQKFLGLYEFSAERHLFDEIREHPSRPAIEQEDQWQSTEFTEELQNLSEDARRDSITLWLQLQLCRLLGYRDPSDVDPELTFAELGMDSLVAMELRQDLRRLTSQDASAKLFYQYPSIQQLSEELSLESYWTGR